ATRVTGTVVGSVAPLRSDGVAKLGGLLLAAPPGTEPEVLDALAQRSEALDDDARAVCDALHLPGAVVLVGERLAGTRGGMSAALRVAAATGARLAWIPRRAGERGALEAGCLPGLLPGGRPVADAAARAEVATIWGAQPPSSPGRDTTAILLAARDGELEALVIAGVDLDDLPDPQLARDALAAVPFVLSLELRSSAVTERADVVLPVAPAVEKSGTFLNWEGRARPFDAALLGTGALPDCRVLDSLAEELDVALGTAQVETVRTELDRLGPWAGTRPAPPNASAASSPVPTLGQAVLAGWHLLLDDGSLQDDEPHLAGTRRPAVARLSAATAAEIGARAGAPVTVATAHGSVTLPLMVTSMPDRVAWLPICSPGSHVRRQLRVESGALVRISVGEVDA
ncbi:MAG TPA: molybdopterin-dependent oxidoreductase, partial [Mycobacteriales bacterium]|nr:molybdopterin-dependent oxidoreductase [Mycobacteriales bacterium]